MQSRTRAHPWTPVCASLLVLLVAACAGGGGSSSDAPAPPPVAASAAPAPAPNPEVAFSSFQAVQPNQTVVMSGISQSGTGMATGSTGNWTITSFGFNQMDTANSTVKLGYDAATLLSAIQIETPQVRLLFSRDTDSTISCASGVCRARSANGSQNAVAIDARTLGWNYQSFGVWGVDTPPSGQFGALSAGAATPASAVPTVGTATFTGMAAGFYIDSAGIAFGTAATMTANVDFSARGIFFSTNGTLAQNVNTGAQAANPGLNLSGTLTYGAGSNQFSGTVNTANSALSGNATGRFYGPNAEEIGGVYALSGSGVSRMLGGFGGKR